MRNSTAKPIKRHVFHEHIILLIEGRLLMLLFIGVTGFIWYLFFRDTSALLDKAILFPLCLTALVCISLREFWYRCFGRLIIAENEIIWKCPFMKARRLGKAEIKYAGFDFRFSSGSLRNITTMDMIYFSKHPYPEKYVGKSYKLRPNDDFIKFHASKKLCLCLLEWLPEPCNRVFAAAYDSFLRQQTRRHKKRTKRSHRLKV